MRTNLTAAIAGAFLVSAIAAAPAHADDATANDVWTGSGELGLAIAKGNTDSQTLVGKLGIAKETARWKHSAGAAFLYGKSDDEENARRYEVFANSGYRLGERSYVVGSLRNERDHFAPNEYQWTASAGYGIEAIKNETTHLTFEAGPGYRWAKLQDVRVHNNEAVLRGFMDFGHRLTETTELFNTLLIEAGADNTFARNDFGVKVKMTDALALKAGFEVRHNTDVPVDTKRTDTLTTVNVVYGF
jgi:putative salt-induced outer membrane protein